MLVRTLILFLIDLGVMGLQLLNGNYDVLTAAYIAAPAESSCLYALSSGCSAAGAHIAAS